MKRLLTTALLLVLGIWASADAPRRTEQFVYTVRAYDTVDYVSTFVREESAGLYVPANADTIVVARKSFVYYWAITDEWRIDTETLNRPLEGTLVITERGGTQRRLERVPYTIYKLQRPPSTWEVATGENAWSRYDDFRESYNRYLEDLRTYNRLADDFAEQTIELANVIVAEREAGRDITSLLEEFRSREAPVAPRVPATYSAPPGEPQLAFVLNLPAGEYDMAFHDEDGHVVEGSEHSLRAFSPLDSDWAGIEVIPADRWTRPVQSHFPGADIYADGSVDIYLRPFIQNRYNEFAFAKLRDNNAQASPAPSIWIRHSDLPNASIELQTSTETTTIGGARFAVEQLEASAPGYRIRALAADSSESPDLIAHPIGLSGARWDRAVVSVIAPDGRPYPGGTRELRVIRRDSLPLWTALLVAWPFLAFGLVRLRNLRSRQQPRVMK